MQPPNPYAPPVAEAFAPAFTFEHESVWQQGGDVVCVKGAEWPDRCVRCNAPAQGYRLKRSLYWHQPWVYALILIGVLIYVIVALIVRKTATIHVGLCPQHRARRRNGILIGWLGTLAAISTCSFTVGEHPGPGLTVGIAGTLGCIAAAMVMTRTVLPSRIDDVHAWVKAGRAFVASLPQRL